MNARPSRILHALALLTAAATFPLIFMGGLVTSHSAGMSVPDWPNSYGYNMFLFPPRLWIGGILYEHTHRLMATVVGMCAIALTLAAWRLEPRRWARWLATAVLGMVILQGILGGLRVVLVQLDLAIVHACVAQAFFCLAAAVCVVTSPWWARTSHVDHPHGRQLITLAIVATVTIYLQLIVGATMRHERAGLAIPDLPLAYGHLIPPTDPASLSHINYQRIADGLDPVTAGQIWLHFAHRLGALAVTCVLLVLIFLTLLRHRDQPKLLTLAVLLFLLLCTQLTLGVLTVLKQKPADIASAHVAVGALTLVTTCTLAVRAARLYAAPRVVFARPKAAASEDRVHDAVVAGNVL